MERRIESAASVTDPTDWRDVARSMGRVVSAASEALEMVGPVMDVGLVDRECGVLRTARFRAADLAQMGDEALEGRVQEDGPLMRFGRWAVSRAVRWKLRAVG